ncbi:RpiB/LacA/LacB family sugar-phosphate isomerase [Sutcliffiella horikoshii]|uniref:RpiB/LacA/LacB family sugar-phosphate isomerase n=1 Tax=Sutcliffiella horikoshii TaxID=79883 RepID=UPI001CBC0FDB|nr:RpiB/LacA/LacB family sugar-phosphate isomerase [Sutcliffiella horikoshii]UAL47353.1 RpiB/LacA/LacB family sugar-phosphate isomerase [Sutcliffiella horikoshii]
MKKIAIGSDHGGYELKEALKSYLTELGYEYLDFGCKAKESVDYPDIAFLVGECVATNTDYVGIMIDGVGVGSGMVLNKIPGVRGAVCWDLSSVINSREHNNANVLSIGGQFMGEGLAKQLVKKWLETEFAGGRHDRRVTKVMEIESRFLKR